MSEASRLALELSSVPAEGQLLLTELAAFCQALLQAPLDTLADIAQPRLLSLDEACSWASAAYLAIVTNPSHNPLCVAVRKWLMKRFPSFSWFGWPDKRSVALSEIIPGHPGRVQWQLVGVNHQKHQFVVAETKSVTANHWGDKSKELYDRIAETRRACQLTDYSLLVIGVLDGDIGAEAIDEIRSGRAHDEVYSFDEVISGIAAP